MTADRLFELARPVLTVNIPSLQVTPVEPQLVPPVGALASAKTGKATPLALKDADI
jgi:hypothetical protein